jgi:hypothetical protein
MKIVDPKKIAFCIVDDIETYADEKIKQTVRNLCDFTISNLHTKGYPVFVGNDENELLRNLDHEYAVVMSPGTEYINGFAFFEALDALLEKEFFIAGHVLDRTMYDAYYELHHQCYVVNMAHYNALRCPTVGSLEQGILHIQTQPIRSVENYHDNYTPRFVFAGTNKQEYSHRCHGWNLLKLAFENNLSVIVFDETIRNNKKHYYPESPKDFFEEAKYIQEKFNYCKEEFVHTDNTEWTNGITETYEQLVVPASGTLYLDLIERGTVVFYDYNQRALDYWKEHCPAKEGVEYKFVHTNLLEELSIVDHVDSKAKTLVNLSNVFCYEGTAAVYGLSHRLNAQNSLVEALKSKVKKIDINFTMKADAGH